MLIQQNHISIFICIFVILCDFLQYRHTRILDIQPNRTSSPPKQVKEKNEAKRDLESGDPFDRKSLLDRDLAGEFKHQDLSARFWIFQGPWIYCWDSGCGKKNPSPPGQQF